MTLRHLALLVWFAFADTCRPHAVWAAACCGGGVATANIITGNERQILAAELSHAVQSRDALATGEWREKSNPDASQGLGMQFSRIVADRYQFGTSVQLVRRESAFGQATGFGDTALTFGYEALPEWEYSVWRPKGFVYLSAVLPTGRSNLESQSDSFLDVRGRGFWSLGAGFVLLKTYRKWDSVLQGEVYRAFPRNVELASGSAEAIPGWGGTFAAGAGYSRGKWRVGAGINHRVDEPIKVIGRFESRGSAQQSTAALLQFSYQLSETLTTTLRYSDLGVLGQPLGVGLAKTVTLAASYRWDR